MSPRPPSDLWTTAWPLLPPPPAAAAAAAAPPAAPSAGDSFGDNLRGFLLAVASSAFIGASFIVKKKGLKRAGAAGSRAGIGGYGYLLEPLWWVGMVTMIIGEIANFVAYVFAPAVLVTPLGALSIIVSAVLAHFILKEKLQRMGVLGCVLCIIGSTVIVLHAPEEKSPSSVEQIWDLATQPAFLLYAASAVAISLVLMLHCSPRYGQTNVMVYVGICSVIGSLTVMSIKAIGIAIKLTIEGIDQAGYYQTWVFAMVAISCIIIQLNYLNKMNSSPSQCFGKLRDLYTPLSPKIYWHIQGNGEFVKHKNDDLLSGDFIAMVRQDYFV
ncbi:putative magnesium transporter NIPA6 [Ananas comosus]|uniref:Probable magnesium transporter n=1 Tax=Ananas comosus TaxID=4615 RepID=A0A199UFP3_ANACO|nr:putative magnesium transporter NIPA6 [Ananas comosus]